ncbi:hypothetical protein [Azospirillum sp.]|uniref:hypothetical protein n=1 Tax=Azospirillum sp. TaxID=34012 RepID=UPI002D39C298|nr:hypothetical protein [Azospirillum sp.]HYD67512.1 hypothetical protein [Azospirillum sp.]
MSGFTVSVNAWGVHIGLHRDLAPSEVAEWRAALRDVGERFARGGRPQGLFVDLRDGVPGGGAMEALVAVLTRAGNARCAVISGDAAGAATLSRAVRHGDSAGSVRVFLSDGRDRPLLAAAYAWVLNGVEPATDLHRGGDPGKVVPFRPRPVGQPAGAASAASRSSNASMASAGAGRA